MPARPVTIVAPSKTGEGVRDAMAGRVRGSVSRKRDAILDAAAAAFLTHGYAAASMASIARSAGVAKQTVYSHFGSKAALFEAIIQRKCDELLSPLSLPTTADSAPEDVLLDVARGFLATVLASDAMDLFRTLLAETNRVPELAEAFYRAGPAQAAENLAEYLRQVSLNGRLRVSDPICAARQFFAMLRGDLYMRHLLGLARQDDAADLSGEMDAAARQAVTVFLAGHR